MATNGNRLTDMEFDEISLVTRPANQLSKVVLFKSDDKERKNMPKNKMDEMYEDEDLEKEMEEEEVEDDEEMQMKKGRRKKAMPFGKSDEDVNLPSEVFDYIEALESANAELADQLEKMAYDEESSSTDILKSADPQIIEIVKAAEERAQAAEMIAKAERDHRLEQEFISKAASELDALPVNPKEFGLVLKNASDHLHPDTFESIMDVLRTANSLVDSGNVFTELGKASSFDNNSPLSEINKAAARLVSENPGMTQAQAVAKAVESNPNLYTAHLRGN